MKKYFVPLFLLLCLSTFSQSSNNIYPVQSPSEIVKDILSWVIYERDHLVWSADYLPLDSSMKIIPKADFLEQLASGRFLPLKMVNVGGVVYYQLHPIEEGTDKDIAPIIRNMAFKQLQYYKMEGIPLPDFNFTDLKGQVYNKETAQNKLIVLNCWFVHCQPCVAEIPSLNQLVKKFERKKDVLFIALTLDKADKINSFLSTNSFKYSIIPDKDDYLTNTLKIIGYPTQLIVNREGLIVKVIESNKIKELTDVLNKELDK